MIKYVKLRTPWQTTGYQISRLPSLPDPWAGERTCLFGQSFTTSVIARPPDQVRGHACSDNPPHSLSLPDLFGQSRKKTGFSAHPSLDQGTKDDTRKPCSKTTGNSQVKSGNDKLEICVIMYQLVTQDSGCNIHGN